MSSWALFLLITFVLGIVISNIMLLKHSAKMKMPENIMRAIQKKNEKAAVLKDKVKKKPAKE